VCEHTPTYFHLHFSEIGALPQRSFVNWTMSQYGHFGGGGGGRDGRDAIDPSDLMSGTYASPSFSSHNFHSPNPNNHPNAFSTGSAMFGDDELLDGLTSPTDPHGTMSGHGHDFRSLDMNMAFSHDAYGSHPGSTGLHLNQNHINGYSNTPDGEPIQSPYHSTFTGGPFRQVHPNQPSLGTSLHSPISYSGSPHGQSDLNADGHRRAVAPAMQHKSSTTRSPVAPKTASMHPLPIGSQDATPFGAQPIRTSNHAEKPSADPWMHASGGGSLGAASFGSGFSSPLQHGMVPISEIVMKGGTSMPAKLGVAPGAVSSQEMKRKKRRESHNLVERRRRDNINERIQDLSRLVPVHRLEDEKVRKMLQNGTPLSPTLSGMAKPSQATSGLAGPGARRATGGAAGNITTGLPVEEKDKGPNKGDILNGAVGWTRDLMWMLHLKLQQQDELANYIAELGGTFPFQITEDERRMQSELEGALSRNSTEQFSYSRTTGTSLRVPGHTDYRGDPLNGTPDTTIADGKGNPVVSGDLDDVGNTWADSEYWANQDDDNLNLKEEDEYEMDLTQ
jgi:hypothetical protein